MIGYRINHINMQLLNLEDFPVQTFDKLRYADMDRLGHVNNAVFSTFLETGRVELLYHPDNPVVSPDTNFVVASLQLNFLREIKWPGQVDIGSGVIKIGNSSLKVYQQIFQNGQCVANAETVIVQIGKGTAKSVPLSDEAKAKLEKWRVNV